jgi:hypothetical protein
MAAQPQYDTGFFSGPGDLLTQANQVNAQVQALDAAIDGNEAIPQDWWDGFQAFKSNWLAFFSSTFGGHGFAQGPSGTSASATGSWLTSDLAGNLASYEAQIASWATQAQKYGVSIPGGVIQPNSDANNAAGLFAGIEGVIIALIVLLLVFKVKA